MNALAMLFLGAAVGAGAYPCPPAALPRPTSVGSPYG